jgi:ribosomal silencing factor RsfS
MDLLGCVVHIMEDRVRARYDLEGLYAAGDDG